MRIYFENVCGEYKSELLEMRVEADTVSLLVTYPPAQSVSGLVDSLKGVSSRLLRASRPDVHKMTGGAEGVLWSPSYDAVSVEG